MYREAPLARVRRVCRLAIDQHQRRPLEGDYRRWPAQLDCQCRHATGLDLVEASDTWFREAHASVTSMKPSVAKRRAWRESFFLLSKRV
jgi:hypothetical protein